MIFVIVEGKGKLDSTDQVWLQADMSIERVWFDRAFATNALLAPP